MIHRAAAELRLSQVNAGPALFPAISFSRSIRNDESRRHFFTCALPAYLRAARSFSVDPKSNIAHAPSRISQNICPGYKRLVADKLAHVSGLFHAGTSRPLRKQPLFFHAEPNGQYCHRCEGYNVCLLYVNKQNCTNALNIPRDSHEPPIHAVPMQSTPPMGAASASAPATRRERGLACEGLAADYLEAHGLQVLARNAYCRRGELDLVCLDGAVLVVVEVRQRAGNDYGGPLSSIDGRKQHKIIMATQVYLQRRPEWRGRFVRFDVVAISGDPAAAHDLVWIKDAFRAT